MDINLTRRQIIIIAIVVLLLIIIIIALLAFNKPNESKDEFVPEIYDSTNINSQATTKQSEVINEESASVMAVARNFTARYLSFSNENWGDNIIVLEGQMTDKMREIASSDLNLQKKDYPSNEFYGVSAKVLSYKIYSQSEDAYIIDMSTQLQITVGNREEINYVDYRIELIL